MIERRPIIGVIGSHTKEWAQYAEPVGALIAEFDYHLLTGAGAGVMSAVAKAFTESGPRKGMSIGVVPVVDYDGGFVSRDQYPNPYIEIPILTPLDPKTETSVNPFSRNNVNVMSSHGIIVLPGDHGTRTEVSLALQYKKPMVLFGATDDFEKFPEQRTRVSAIDGVREFLDHVSSKFRSDIEKSEG